MKKILAGISALTVLLILLSVSDSNAQRYYPYSPYYDSPSTPGMRQYDQEWGRWQSGRSNYPPRQHWSQDPSYNWGKGRGSYGSYIGGSGYYRCEDCRY